MPRHRAHWRGRQSLRRGGHQGLLGEDDLRGPRAFEARIRDPDACDDRRPEAHRGGSGGYAYGAGLALASASDYVVAATNAKFSCAFIRVALAPDLGLLWTLPRRIGLGRAKRFIVTGKPFDAEYGEQIGLVDDLAPAGGALARAYEVAEELAQAPTLSIELMKATLAEGLDDVLRREIDMQSVLLLSEDLQEGKSAFLEKRKPHFVGR